MAAGMIPKGGGGGGILGLDLFGNQGANPRPNLRDFSNPASATTSGWEGMRRRSTAPESLPAYEMAAAGKPTIRHTPSSQTAQQYQDFQQANKDWAAIEAARKKRQEAYLAMAQKTGPTPAAFNANKGGGTKKAGDPLTMGVAAPANEMALYGQPRKWRDQYASIVNLRNA